jgi:hypothetical protein
MLSNGPFRNVRRHLKYVHGLSNGQNRNVRRHQKYVRGLSNGQNRNVLVISNGPFRNDTRRQEWTFSECQETRVNRPSTK